MTNMKEIIIEIKAGCVIDVYGVPKGVPVVIRDFDTCDEERLITLQDGRQCSQEFFAPNESEPIKET